MSVLAIYVEKGRLPYSAWHGDDARGNLGDTTLNSSR